MTVARPARAPERSVGAGGRQAPGRVLWIRYAVLGVLLGMSWIGNGSEPAWEHALRVAVMLLSVTPLLAVLRRRNRAGRARASPPGRTARTSSAWLVAGVVAFKVIHVVLALAVADLLAYLVSQHADQRATSGWLLAGVRLLVLVALVLAGNWHERRRTGRGWLAPGRGSGVPGGRSWLRFAAAKIILICAALGLQTVLAPRLAGADIYVAAALALTVITLGPRLHPYLFRTAAPVTDHAGRGRVPGLHRAG